MVLDDEDVERLERVRQGILGLDSIIHTVYGQQTLLYADWCASGRMYGPIERFMAERVAPYTANTHTESNTTGTAMTRAYRQALTIIKSHVRAGLFDIVLTTGTGMTGAVNKLQRLLGLRLPEVYRSRIRLANGEKPLIIITHMEHHSNHISWLETIGDVIILPPDSEGMVSPKLLDELLIAYKERPYKIGAFTACSNVTGLVTPIHELAKVMHRHGGLCFVDYSASAPYVDINMHPEDPEARLDAVMFSPHKFLGGPGTSGVLVMDSRLIRGGVPDQPGGGTVAWTDPWGGRVYLQDLEEREDGGTPGFLQAIRTAMCIRLKDYMGTERMAYKEQLLMKRLWSWLDRIPTIDVLEGRNRKRKAIVAFTVAGYHHNLVTRLLNDRFGIQSRGGCSCAGSYGHYLFGIKPTESQHLSGQIAQGNKSNKPGWIRISLHPTMTLSEVDRIGGALRDITTYGEHWRKDYVWDPVTGDYYSILKPVGSIGEEWLSSNQYLG